MRCTKAGERGRRAALVVGSLLVIGVGSAPPAGAAEVRDITRFACPPGLSTPFTDIAGSVHETAIECAVHHELTGGTTASTFSPSATVTRGQMATFLANLLGLVGVQPGDFDPTGFTDIAGSAHEGSIEAIYALGIAQGTSATTFSPGDPVSRAQMATFLTRTLELVAVELPPPGPDAFDDDDGLAHEAAIQAIADAGIAGGTGPRAYGPTATVSRGAMASFLVRVIDLGIEQGLHGIQPTSASYAVLDGVTELPAPGDPDGSGSVEIVTTDVPGVVCVAVVVEGVAAPTSLRIHQGTPGADGPAVVDLPVPVPGQFLTRCVSDPDAAAIQADPGAHYVEVRTAEHPNGALRGQLGEVGVEFGADLSDVEVVPGPGDPDALGIYFGFTTTQPGVVCGSLLALSGDAVTGAQLHQGAPHANGPVVLELDPITFTEADSGQLLGIECARTDLADELAADPAAFYVDVHTTAFPDGAVRGQLQPGAVFGPLGAASTAGGGGSAWHAPLSS